MSEQRTPRVGDDGEVRTLDSARRNRKSRDDGRCACGSYRAHCSPYGRQCCYDETPIRGEQR